MVVGGYDSQAEPLEVVSRAAKAANAWRSRTLAKLYVSDTLLEQLVQDLQDVAAELRELIEKHKTMVRQPHLARYWQLPASVRPISEMV
jgi:hypothetical protein